MNTIIQSYKKISNIGKVLVWISILFIIVNLFHFSTQSKKEGFQQKDEFIHLEDNTKIYDDFYATVYDSLVGSPIKDDYEISEWVNYTQPTNNSIILDIGCGNGHHVSKISEMGFEVLGIDNSQAMVNNAIKTYPGLNFKKEDALRSNTFQSNSFTHILSLYFTVYYMKNKRIFFENCFHWLKRGGYLTVHLVDRDNFDPILNPANPILFVSPQKYAKERITSSKVIFEGFDYHANFDLKKDKDIAHFTEKFTEKESKKVRKQDHTLYMEDLDIILQMARETGFVLLGKIDLVKVQYEYQYIYVFQKPE